jgi:tRNA(Ile)-lysidine synthase
VEVGLVEAWPPADWCDSHVVLAVSSGPDSVALLRAMLAVKARSGGPGELIVAHFNHAVRGTAADADQAWLESLCSRLDVPLVVGRAIQSAANQDQGNGWEAAARNARYRFLCETAEGRGARFVAVAHTSDDQVETVLHRILRGTGLEGLAGMPRYRHLTPSVTLVRPLLEQTRKQILQYLAAIGQDFRTDETNADTRWTRNRLRHEVLPLLRERFNSDVDQALLRLAAQAGEAHHAIVGLARPLAEECVSLERVRATPASTESSRLRIKCGRLEGRPQSVVREVARIAWQQTGWPLQAMGFEQWQQLAELIANVRSPSINLPGNIRARREGDVLVVEVMA